MVFEDEGKEWIRLMGTEADQRQREERVCDAEQQDRDRYKKEMRRVPVDNAGMIRGPPARAPTRREPALEDGPQREAAAIVGTATIAETVRERGGNARVGSSIHCSSNGQTIRPWFCKKRAHWRSCKCAAPRVRAPAQPSRE
jgi:hypothetical protein